MNAFVFLTEWKEWMAQCPAPVRCQIYEAVIDYVTAGTIPTLDPVAMGCFKRIYTNLNDKAYLLERIKPLLPGEDPTLADPDEIFN